MDYEIQEGRDYYLDKDGKAIFTEYFLLKMGQCCNHGCKHCPYKKKNKKIKP